MVECKSEGPAKEHVLLRWPLRPVQPRQAVRVSVYRYASLGWLTNDCLLRPRNHHATVTPCPVTAFDIAHDREWGQPIVDIVLAVDLKASQCRQLRVDEADIQGRR